MYRCWGVSVKINESTSQMFLVKVCDISEIEPANLSQTSKASRSLALGSVWNDDS